jgi:histidyl-tRNA synthetase
MTESIRAVRGMHDILPPESSCWVKVEQLARTLFNAYGYAEIRLPIVEHEALFVRSIGEVTDIVEKEMYTFVDQLSDEKLALRPEGTAGCVRAAIEHHLTFSGPKRLFYVGPMFRHERPQKGRYRQFHHIGVESFLFSGPEIEAEQLLLIARLWQALGIEDLRLEINSLGDQEARAIYRQTLQHYFSTHEAVLDEDAQKRLHTNPLRLLDSKNPAMQEVIAKAPSILDALSPTSRQRFDDLLELLEKLGITFTVNPRMVRGLDYYNDTVFEWTTTKLGAQATVCAGGRYDTLVENLGGKPTPAFGFAIGVERLMALLPEVSPYRKEPVLHVYAIPLSSAETLLALRFAEDLRSCGLLCEVHLSGGSIKSAMRKANASGAYFAALFGEEERLNNQVSLKSLRTEEEQQRLGVSQALQWITQHAAC